MKLTIEIDLHPSEIPLATEMFNILRQITTHVKAKNAPQLFKGLITKLEDKTQLEQVSGDINKLLEEAGPESLNEFFSAFTEIVFDPDLVSRNQSVVPFFLLLPRYFIEFLIFRLVEPHRTSLRDKLISVVLTFLTQKRPLDSNRLEFFAHAESFAALVKLEFVKITGAVATITTLLQKPENRCAAVTMLGKTVELCLSLLKEKCDLTTLQDLRQCLRTHVTDDIFRYDVDYIEKNMNWKRESPSPKLSSELPSSSYSNSPLVAPQAIKAKNGPLPTGLVATHSLTGGHSNTIFAIAYDELRDQLISSGKDGVIVVWNSEGKQEEHITLPKHYACSLDVNPRQGSVFLCGVPKDPKEAATNPAIISYSVSDQGEWTFRGALERTGVKLVSSVKALVYDSTNTFVTGESAKSPRERELLRVYDASVGNWDHLEPLVSYEEHEDIITSLAHFPGREGLFFSGSRDCTVKLWDKRIPKSVGTLGSYQPGSSKVVAHDGMVTCLDAQENVLISAGLDKKVALWDLRMRDSHGYSQPLRRIAVDEYAVLKVAVGPTAASCAVSTLKGLYFVDFVSGVATPAAPFADLRPMRRYHDLRWHPRRPVLFAAGDEKRVDSFAVNFS